MYFPTTSSNSSGRSGSITRLHTNQKLPKTSSGGWFTAFVGLLATVNPNAVQAAASPSWRYVHSSRIDGSLATILTPPTVSTVPNTSVAVNTASPADDIVKLPLADLYPDLYKRADNPSPGIPFGEALKQHKEIRDDLAANGLKYDGNAIVPDGDKKPKDDRKRKMWLGIDLGLGLGLPGTFLVGLAVKNWGPELFNYLRGSPAETAKLFNMKNINIETMERTLENLARETPPNPPPAVDAPAQGSTPLAPSQAANLPAGSSVQVAFGSSSILSLEAGGSATLPAGAEVQPGVDIEVTVSEAETTVTNVGQAAASLGMSMPSGAISGLLQIGSSVASIASQTGGSLNSELVDGKTVLKLESASVEEMQGNLSDNKGIPESWDAAKEAVKADQDQHASRVDKGKQPDRGDEGKSKHSGSLKELREYHDKKRAEKESEEKELSRLRDEAKRYEKDASKAKELQEKEDKRIEKLKKDIESSKTDFRNREKEREKSDKDLADLKNKLEKLKEGMKKQQEKIARAKESVEKSKQEDANWEEQEKNFEKEVIKEKHKAQESKKKAEENHKKAQDEAAKRRESDRKAEEERKKAQEEEKKKRESEKRRGENEKKRQENEKKTQDAQKKEKEAKEKVKAAEVRKAKIEEKIKVTIKHNEQVEHDVTKVTIEYKRVNKLLSKNQDRLKLVRKSLLAAKAKVEQKCLDWFAPNRCGETPICQAHPKGGDVCWHPGQSQKAKQCWMPKGFPGVMQDSGLCGGKIAPPSPLAAPACKGQEGVPSLEDVRKNHNSCPLYMVCPAMLPPLDFTKCMPKYRCSTGGPLIKPGHGAHGSVHGGAFLATSNQTLSTLDKIFENRVDLAEEDGPDNEINGDRVSEEDNDDGKVAIGIDGDMHEEDGASMAGYLDAYPEDKTDVEIEDQAEKAVFDTSDVHIEKIDPDEAMKSQNDQEQDVGQALETGGKNAAE